MKGKTKSAAERRVAVAKDVLKQLDARKMLAVAGVYCNFSKPYSEKEDKEPKAFHEFVKNASCRVCAIGGLFVSMVRIEDSFAPGYRAQFRARLNRSVMNTDMRMKLEKIFSSDQLRVIEHHFETWNLDIKDSDSLENFFNSSDESRMRAIMKNIIKNRGTFKPKTMKVSAK